MSDAQEVIREQIENNPVILYMKGSPDAPQCGFSSRASQAVMAAGERFAFVDVCLIQIFARICQFMPTGQPSRSFG